MGLMRHLVLALGLVACASSPGSPPLEPVPAKAESPLPHALADLVGKPAPRFSLPSASDETTITVPSREVTVVTFFGTWSMGWQVALPTLEELRKKHAGLRVVAVSMDETKPEAVAVAKQYSPLPVAWAGGMATKTNAEWLSGPYGGENKIFVLDRKGTIRFAHGGGKEYSVLAKPEGKRSVETEIATLLAEP